MMAEKAKRYLCKKMVSECKGCWTPRRWTGSWQLGAACVSQVRHRSAVMWNFSSRDVDVGLYQLHSSLWTGLNACSTCHITNCLDEVDNANPSPCPPPPAAPPCPDDALPSTRASRRRYTTRPSPRHRPGRGDAHSLQHPMATTGAVMSRTTTTTSRPCRRASWSCLP
jgi:hypothetical protein